MPTVIIASLLQSAASHDGTPNSPLSIRIIDGMIAARHAPSRDRQTASEGAALAILDRRNRDLCRLERGLCSAQPGTRNYRRTLERRPRPPSARRDGHL